MQHNLFTYPNFNSLHCEIVPIMGSGKPGRTITRRVDGNSVNFSASCLCYEHDVRPSISVTLIVQESVNLHDRILACEVDVFDTCMPKPTNIVASYSVIPNSTSWV